MKHLGKYQQSIGKKAYVPNYSVCYKTKDEPRLFSDEQAGFFASVDSGVKTTDIFPYNDLIFPCFFRMQYCCGMRHLFAVQNIKKCVEAGEICQLDGVPLPVHGA